ncbi:MAG: FecR domain-containing protein [Acetobacteraceae bacterium]|nr:FecR domain-containing protein [Acetobacteraceae bacterium]
MLRRLVGALFAILALPLWASPVSAATVAGTVVAVSGPCAVPGRPLKSGDALQVSDTVDVPAGCNLKLRMADGSVVLVSPGSSLTVAGYNVSGGARYARLSLRQGLLRILVTPVGGPSTFEVSTAVGTASVRSDSADWLIKAQAGSAQVGVLAGKVDFKSATTGRSVSIPKRWGTRLEAQLDPVLPRVWSYSEFTSSMDLTRCCQSSQPKEESSPSNPFRRESNP